MSFKEILDNVSNIENLDNVTILKTLQKFSGAIKDFAEQQSGLENLINVEFITTENSVTYADGVVDYLGELKITLAENIIVNKPCSVKFNIKGSETIVVDVDEFDNALEIHLDSDIINKIDRALLLPLDTPSEDEFVVVGTNNSQKKIPSSEIEKTAYKMNSILEFNSNMNNTDFYPSFALLDEFSRGKNLFTFDYNLDSWDNLKNWVQNEAPTGSYIKNITISGNWTVIIQKTSSSYASIVRFWYENNKIQKCKLYAGNWSDFEDV